MNAAPAQVTLLTLSTSPGHHGEMLVVADGEIDLCTGSDLLSFLLGAMRHPSCRTLVADHSAVLRPLRVTATIDQLTLYPTIAAA